MKTPNLFIVGMPKSGTSSLWNYLRQHPNIFMTTPKDVNYFTEEVHPRYRYAKTKYDYLNMFKKSTDQHRVLGEASTRYCLHIETLRRIYEFNPSSKIILMIRNPVDIVVSLHAMLVRAFDENETDLEKAWRLQEGRLEGFFISKGCLEPYFLQYKQVAKSGEKLEQILEFFPSNQVMVIRFDDFVLYTKEIYKRVLVFLDVPLYEKLDFKPVNVKSTHVFKRMAKFISRPPDFLYNAAVKVREKTGIPYLGMGPVLNLIGKWNRKTVKEKIELRPEFRAELLDKFKEDTVKLSQLLNRNFLEVGIVWS